MEEILQGTAEIVAETSVGYFQDTFSTRPLTGTVGTTPGPQTIGVTARAVRTLLNSIRPVVVTPGRIVIAAGNEKVDCARVHNEGFKGAVAVPAHIRHTRRGDQSVRQHTRRVNIPGDSLSATPGNSKPSLQKESRLMWNPY